MTRPYVLMLMVSTLWVFGTLPWLVVNRFLCTSNAPDICANPETFGQQASSILLVDALLIAASVYAILQLRRMNRSR